MKFHFRVTIHFVCSEAVCDRRLSQIQHRLRGKVEGRRPSPSIGGLLRFRQVCKRQPRQGHAATGTQASAGQVSEIRNPKSEIHKWLPRLALLLILAGQLNYLPARLRFLRQMWDFARLQGQTAAARLAYGAADYDVLEWVKRKTPPDTALLLLTASPDTYGDPSYVLYHRAIYHLYPRSVWWAAPVPATRYPAWWIFTDLTEADILTLAELYQATAILADGFSRPPVSGPFLSFDQDTHLIFLDGGP